MELNGEKVLLPWGIDYCKCGSIKTSHTPLCVDCIKHYKRQQKINKLLLNVRTK